MLRGMAGWLAQQVRRLHVSTHTRWIHRDLLRPAADGEWPWPDARKVPFDRGPKRPGSSSIFLRTLDLCLWFCRKSASRFAGFKAWACAMQCSAGCLKTSDVEPWGTADGKPGSLPALDGVVASPLGGEGTSHSVSEETGVQSPKPPPETTNSRGIRWPCWFVSLNQGSLK